MKQPHTRLFKRLHPYVWVSFLAAFLVQMLTFYGTRIFLTGRLLHHLATPWDLAIPFIPQWIIIYVLSFAEWIVFALWILSESKQRAYRFSLTYILALCLSAAVFLIYPGTMDRPVLVGDGIFIRWMRFLYAADSPTNLCPSLHVLITYLCFRGALGSRIIPKWAKVFSFLFLILVCFSILFVKQHVLVDIPAALLIAELAWQIGKLTRIERLFFALEKTFHMEASHADSR